MKNKRKESVRQAVLWMVCFVLFAWQGRAQYSPASSYTDDRGNPLFAQLDCESLDARMEMALNMHRIQSYRFPSGNDFKEEMSKQFGKKPRKKDSLLYQASPGVDPKLLTFAQRNSGAFKRKKKGGMKDPGMASLCAAVLPGLGQIYNGQWYKTPVLYAGVGVLAYFTDMNLKQRKIYDKEIKARTDSTAGGFNTDLASYTLEEILELRNYYEQNFELCLIIAGAVYLLNIMDAAVYAHLSSFNVSPNLSLSIKPYARTRFSTRNAFPLDAGIRVCLSWK